MKTKTNFRLFIPALVVGLVTFLSSCSDDFNHDIRDEITGIYKYEIKIYDNLTGELVYLGDQEGLYDIEGTMLVKKNPMYADMVDFYDGDVLMFQGEKIRDEDNAIVFDIPIQEGWVGPVPIQISGYEYWETNNRKYHGAYFYADDTFEIAFSAYVMDVDSGLVMVLIAWRD